jgi:hypothetical protein
VISEKSFQNHISPPFFISLTPASDKVDKLSLVFGKIRGMRRGYVVFLENSVISGTTFHETSNLTYIKPDASNRTHLSTDNTMRERETID